MEANSRRQPLRRRPAVALLVVGGLVVSIGTAVFLIDPPAGGLPGVALGSEAISPSSEQPCCTGRQGAVYRHGRYAMKGAAMMMDIEDRIFELGGQEPVASKIFTTIVDEYGVDRATARELYVKVQTERGTPNSVALKETIARLKRLSFI
jgi:hypothetical protein